MVDPRMVLLVSPCPRFRDAIETQGEGSIMLAEDRLQARSLLEIVVFDVVVVDPDLGHRACATLLFELAARWPATRRVIMGDECPALSERLVRGGLCQSSVLPHAVSNTVSSAASGACVLGRPLRPS